MILKVNCDKARITQDMDGNLEITFRISRESRWSVKQASSALQEKTTLTVDRYRDRRSLRQNNLMWALLDIMGRSMGQDKWDCYTDMIEEAGAKYEYIECLKEAIPTLKEQFRCLKVIEDRRDGKTAICKVFYGSSKLDTAEMTKLIDAIFDRLAELGVETEDQQAVSYWWREWRDIK